MVGEKCVGERRLRYVRDGSHSNNRTDDRL